MDDTAVEDSSLKFVAVQVRHDYRAGCRGGGWARGSDGADEVSRRPGNNKRGKTRF